MMMMMNYKCMKPSAIGPHQPRRDAASPTVATLYRANEILLTQRNKQTLPNFSQPLTRWSTRQDLSPEPLRT